MALRVCLAVAGDAGVEPVVAQSKVRVVKVAGDRHQLALKSDGSVIGWGQWAYGAAGHWAVAILRDDTVVQWPRRRTPDAEPSFRPTPVPKLANVTQASVAWRHALALTADGHVWAWGSSDNYALGVEPKGGWINDPVEMPGLSDVAAACPGRSNSRP